MLSEKERNACQIQEKPGVGKGMGKVRLRKGPVKRDRNHKRTPTSRKRLLVGTVYENNIIRTKSLSVSDFTRKIEAVVASASFGL